ncbi:hypothetical protein FRB94_005548 [Tulasnella sp. JGI-2019a]|nr:hypothetical protein FRB93_006031 [Tulasnella sp. JGI-2019a]KAG9012612.1 hypothetical protein FRB94_005548 [Tulasnella sp. JGI-2019a]KAG9023793.1 hypothetical protein FRB95_012479 [Tulasnella sp. JGI-2019a]
MTVSRTPPTTSLGKGRLYPLKGGDPLPATSQRMRSIVVAVADLLRQPSSDLQLLLDGLWGELQDSDAIIYVLTEHIDLVEEWLRDSVKAIVVVGTPTHANIKFAVETAASRCGTDGKLLIWMCCNGQLMDLPNGDKMSILRPMDGWDAALNGKDLKCWTSRMPTTSVLTVVLEVCHAGNFMQLPFEFATDGTVVNLKPLEALKGPRIICISACRSQERAHFGEVGELKCGVFSLMLKAEIDARKRDGRPVIRLGELSRLIAPDLNSRGDQNPLVTMSHPGLDAPLAFPGFQ